jgi:cell division inhibitor SepF
LNPQHIPDDYRPRGWWSRLKDGLLGAEEPDDEGAESVPAQPDTAQAARRQQALRLQTARGGRVAIRLNAQVFEDAKLAADGLKGGEHQIVNLERATPQMGERIIDFLNGVCYALDGSVERVGEKVYMFVPANVQVEVDNGTNASASARRPSIYGDTRD